ncbi:MAG: allantoicase [Thermoanaerobaculia bacterium]
MTDDFTELTDLASERLGATVLWANDEFFAPKERLLAEAEPVQDPHRYTDRGTWMDGWETRRRRQPGHDACLIRLGCPGVVRGVVVDTRHFVGNAPQAFALDGVELVSEGPNLAALLAPDMVWQPLLARHYLVPDAINPFPIAGDDRVTHLRFSIFPDGGVARLRVHGEPAPDWQALSRRGEVDLAAAEHGGRVLATSDGFFGRPHNLILPGPPRGMQDGWETRRRRGPGHDWVVVRLARPGRINRIEVDTTFFKGNAPESCRLEGCAPGDYAEDGTPWLTLVERARLEPHACHELALSEQGPPVSHLKLSIFPDGGVARLRAWGRAESEP